MKRLIALVGAALFLATCASAPDKPQQANAVAVTSSPYSTDAKTMPVGVIPAGVLHDTQRNKDLELSIEYPAHDGPYPVIIFSPNYGGSRAGYVGLSAFWASHGYVVIKVSHADAGALKEVLRERVEEMRSANQQRGERRGRGQQPPAQQQPAPPFRVDPAELWNTQKPDDWRNRVDDVKFVIESLPRLIEQYPEIKERIDATRIGVGGHSYGAFTALLLGGVRPSTGVSFADSRVKAVVAMSPPGPSESRGLNGQSFLDLRVPTLFLTGSRDFGASESEDVAWRKQAFSLSPTGDKWFVSIEGAGHSAFTGRTGEPVFEPNVPSTAPYPGRGLPGAYPQQQPMPGRTQPVFRDSSGMNTVKTISLAFWDAYLKNDNAGREYLNKLRLRSDVQVESK